jgi:hypothetical protein
MAKGERREWYDTPSCTHITKYSRKQRADQAGSGVHTVSIGGNFDLAESTIRMYSYETAVIIRTPEAVVYFVSLMDNNFSQNVTRRQLRPP